MAWAARTLDIVKSSSWEIVNRKVNQIKTPPFSIKLWDSFEIRRKMPINAYQWFAASIAWIELKITFHFRRIVYISRRWMCGCMPYSIHCTVCIVLYLYVSIKIKHTTMKWKNSSTAECAIFQLNSLHHQCFYFRNLHRFDFLSSSISYSHNNNNENP